MQTFTAGVTGTMPKITMPLAMGTAGCGGSCSGANAPLPISLYNLDGSNNPTGTALASTSVTNVGAPFQLTEYSLALGAPLVKGNRYGIVLGATNTLGCWGYAFSTNNPYPGGLLRTSTNSGSSWADVGTGNQDLKFSTYLPTPTGGAGASASRGRLLH
jgi:hypothetical protein